MQLDYTGEINEHGEDIVRLYDSNKEETLLLAQAIQQTLVENREELQLYTLEFIESRNCYLTLRLADSDVGILTKDYINFYCFLTIEGYKQMLKLLEPFCKKETKAHQWLYDIDTPTDFLFSPAGTW